MDFGDQPALYFRRTEIWVAFQFGVFVCRKNSSAQLASLDPVWVVCVISSIWVFPATKLAGLTKDVRERQSVMLQPQRSEKDDERVTKISRNCAEKSYSKLSKLMPTELTSCQCPKCAAGNGGMNIIIKNKIVSWCTWSWSIRQMLGSAFGYFSQDQQRRMSLHIADACILNEPTDFQHPFIWSLLDNHRFYHILSPSMPFTYKPL